MNHIVDETERGIPRRIGLGIRAFRHCRRLSEAALGEATGISEQEIRDIEAGMRPVGGPRLEAIAAALDVSLAALSNPPPMGADTLSGLDLPTPEEALAIVKSVLALPSHRRAELLHVLRGICGG
jgi:transcriptional regulator with XRE-family HTH domain